MCLPPLRAFGCLVVARFDDPSPERAEIIACFNMRLLGRRPPMDFPASVNNDMKRGRGNGTGLRCSHEMAKRNDVCCPAWGADGNIIGRTRARAKRAHHDNYYYCYYQHARGECTVL